MVNILEFKDCLQVVVSDDFDFNAANQVVTLCSPKLDSNKFSRIDCRLERLKRISFCAIGALLILRDKVNGNMQVSLTDCDFDINLIFNSQLFDPYFNDTRPQVREEVIPMNCKGCFDSSIQNCLSCPWSQANIMTSARTSN